MTEQNDEMGSAIRHAEYKIPQGKLVVMDLLVEDGCLRNVQLSGDFFLEPPEALTRINDALEGMAEDASSQQLEEAVQNAVAADVSMYGITVAGVVVVVQRALA